MKKSLSAFINICSWLLKNEKELVRRARAINILCVRPSAVVLTVFTLFYIIAPVDLLPEMLIQGVVGLLDDIILGVVSAAYIFSELIYCSGVNIIKKKINLPEYDVENEIYKDIEEAGQDQAVPSANPSQDNLRPPREQPAFLKAVANIWNKLKSFGGQQSDEENPDEDYFD